MKKIDQSSIIICSIVRNAEKGLKRNIPVIQEFCKYFANYRVVVYENDSTDNRIIQKSNCPKRERVYNDKQ